MWYKDLQIGLHFRKEFMVTNLNRNKWSVTYSTGQQNKVSKWYVWFRKIHAKHTSFLWFTKCLPEYHYRSISFKHLNHKPFQQELVNQWMYVMGTSAQQKKKSATYHKVLVISQERTTLPFLKKPIQVSVLYQKATTVVVLIHPLNCMLLHHKSPHPHGIL